MFNAWKNYFTAIGTVLKLRTTLSLKASGTPCIHIQRKTSSQPFDTLNNTFVVDSLGRTADSATLVIDGDSVITVIGAVNAIDWSFDRQLINDFGQPVLDQLEASFNGNQKFKILRLTEDELVLYFDEVIPVSIGTFTADMELRHTEFWQK
ncbi:hypothetical protein N9W65_01730 [Schleiferiaceae bacterium]|nr:hypothetical protein [Schleiferiaceae bacterium]